MFESSDVIMADWVIKVQDLFACKDVLLQSHLFVACNCCASINTLNFQLLYSQLALILHHRVRKRSFVPSGVPNSDV